MPRATMHMQTITVHPRVVAPGDPPFLVVRIELACEVCGEHELVLAGHHIQPLVTLLQGVLAEVDPSLVAGGETTIVQKATRTMTDPRQN